MKNKAIKLYELVEMIKKDEEDYGKYADVLYFRYIIKTDIVTHERKITKIEIEKKAIS